MDTDKVQERVRELDGVVVAVGLTLLMFGSVMIGSGALGVAQSQTTQASAESVSCSVEGLSPVGTASAQKTTDDSLVFYGTNGGYMVARYANNGSVAWNFSGDTEFYAAPTVRGGVVYAATTNFNNDGSLYAIDAKSGEKLWQVENSSVGTGITLANGSVFVPRSNDLLRVNSSTGSIVWEYDAGDHSSPEYNDGVVYVGQADGTVVGVNEKTGNKNFTWSFGGTQTPLGVTVVNNVLYAWSPDTQTVKGYDLEKGAEIMTTQSLAATARPIIVQDSFENKTIYAPADGEVQNGTVMVAAWDANTGEELWNKTDEEITPYASDSAFAYHDGLVVGTNENDNMLALNGTTGRKSWGNQAQDYVHPTPSISRDGVGYVDLTTGGLMAFDASNGSILYKNKNGSFGEPTSSPVTFASDGTVSDGTRIVQSTWGMLGPAQQCEGLWVDTREYMEHNLTVSVSVYAYDEDAGWTDVTNDSNVTVDNTNALTYSDGELTSTTDKSVNEIVEVRAEYDRFYGTADVVVATETVNNTDILPPMQSATATLGDDNGLVVVMATAISAGIAFFASSLAGVAAFPVIITGAWVAGYVGTHILLGGLLMSIFIGLNVAQVVEFSG